MATICIKIARQIMLKRVINDIFQKLPSSLAGMANKGLTNFEKSLQFNRMAGMKLYGSVQHDIFDNKYDMDRVMGLIKEEVGELEVAVKNKDIVETVDALADILYTVYNMGGTIGVDLDKAYDIVHKSNMSKFCQTQEIAQSTIDDYRYARDNNLTTLRMTEKPSLRPTFDGKGWVVYDMENGRILKSNRWSPPDFTSLIDNKN